MVALKERVESLRNQSRLLVDPHRLNIELLPNMPLSERSRLPFLSCIYFAIDTNGVIQYIGRSKKLRSRWVSHHKLESLQCIPDIKIAWLQISEKKFLPFVESMLIDFFDPPLNGLPITAKQKKREKPLCSGMKGLRLQSGKTAAKIAVELGVSVSTVHNWDQGRMMPRMTPFGLHKLMLVYGCSFSDLAQAEIEFTQRNSAPQIN